MFRPLNSKKLSSGKAKDFWKRYDGAKKTPKEGSQKRVSGQRAAWKKFLWITKGRELIAVTPSMAGTVRHFGSLYKLAKFLWKVNKTNKFFSSHKFNKFHFQPTQILSVDFKELRVLERIYPGPAISSVDFKDETASRYFWLFSRKIGLEKLSLEKQKDVKNAILDGYSELVRNASTKIDRAKSNFLVTDFDLETMKPTICIIDHGGSIRVW